MSFTLALEDFDELADVRYLNPPFGAGSAMRLVAELLNASTLSSPIERASSCTTRDPSGQKSGVERHDSHGLLDVRHA